MTKKPAFVAQELARLKSQSVALKKIYKAPFTIIGSDQICVFEDQLLDKPGSLENNLEHLKKLQSKSHTLITAVCLIYQINENENLKYIEFLDHTELKMKPLTDLEILAYVKKDKPFDCAGGYKFESLGHTLLDIIKSEDLSSIEGLPMIKCLKYLKQLENLVDG